LAGVREFRVKNKRYLIIVIITTLISALACQAGNCVAISGVPLAGNTLLQDFSAAVYPESPVTGDIDIKTEEVEEDDFFSVSAFMESYIEAGSRL
jgi:hypothetical protein